MATLGVDTSNYATSLAVAESFGKEVVCAKKRMLPVKEGELGLRQSDAVFHHALALPDMIEEMRVEGVLKEIKAVGVSQKPRPVQGSYMPCFIAGISFAAAFAAALDVPLVRTSHQQGHLMAALYGTGETALLQGENLVFHLSGGTTELLLCRGYGVERTLGQSLDLYAGQAIDRLGVRLGYAFPAGAQVSALAEEWNEEIDPKVSVKGMDCHLSGLQNQCEALLEQGKAPGYVAKYCLSAVAKTAAAMAQAARKQLGPLPLVCAGGVMASSVIRRIMQDRIENIWFVPPQLSADNAVGTALIAAKEAGLDG